jgi:hypothetical protein
MGGDALDVADHGAFDSHLILFRKIVIIDNSCACESLPSDLPSRPFN